MSTNAQRVNSIVAYIKKMKEQNAILLAEQKALKETIAKQKAQIVDIQTVLKENKTQANTATLAQITKQDKAVLRKEINNCIKVIDKIMAKMQE